MKEVKSFEEKSKYYYNGDFNVIPEEIDCHDHLKYQNDALFKLEIRKKFRELLNLGFTDIYRHINKHKQNIHFGITHLVPGKRIMD